MTNDVWLFHGMGGRFTSGVFTSRRLAEDWIRKHGLTGMLTLYPTDIGTYDWAIGNGSFRVNKEEQSRPDFIQKFTTASQEHYHYEDGEEA